MCTQKCGDACGGMSREKEKTGTSRGRSRDSKSSLQSEDVMWTEQSREACEPCAKKSRYCDTHPVP